MWKKYLKDLKDLKDLNNLKDCLRKIGVYLSLMAFIPVLGLEAMYDYDIDVFVLLRALCCLSALICYFKRRKFTRLMQLIAVFAAWTLAVTVFYWNLDLYKLYSVVIIISACAFFDYQIDKNKEVFLLQLYRYCCVTIFLNLLTILFFPEGLYLGEIPDIGCYYLLGNYNLFIVHILPALCVGYQLLADRKIKKRDYIFLWISVAVTYIFKRSMTSIMGLLVFVVFLLFFNKKAWKKVFNPIVYMVSTAVAVYLLVFVQPQFLISLVSTITGKNLTFSGRTMIWSRMIPLFSGHWLMGFGLQDTQALIEAVDFYHAHHAHNLVLQVLWQGGCIGVLLLIGILVITFHSLWKASDHKTARCYCCAIFALLIMSIFEFYEYRAIFSMLVIFYGCCAYTNSLKDEKDGPKSGGTL